jgi:hypothetical protein
MPRDENIMKDRKNSRKQNKPKTAASASTSACLKKTSTAKPPAARFKK